MEKMESIADVYRRTLVECMAFLKVIRYDLNDKDLKRADGIISKIDRMVNGNVKRNNRPI